MLILFDVSFVFYVEYTLKKMSLSSALAVFVTSLGLLGGTHGSQESCAFPLVDSGDRGSCPPNPASSLDEAISNGHRFAPIVKFHPLEIHFMEDPEDWFETSTLYPAPGSGLAKEFRSQYGADTSLLAASELAVNNVTAFDSDGRSTAKVYFTVQEYAVRIGVHSSAHWLNHGSSLAHSLARHPTNNNAGGLLVVQLPALLRVEWLQQSRIRSVEHTVVLSVVLHVSGGRPRV